MTTLKPVELVCLIASCIGEAALVYVLAVARPQFEKMIDDFTSHPPALTEAMLRSPVPWLLAALPSVLLAAGFFRPAKRTQLFVASAFVASASFVLFLIAMYLPLLAVAGEIK